jgi:hypothetical protein
MTRTLFILGSAAIVVLTAAIPAIVTAFTMKAEQWEAERQPLHLTGRDADQKPNHPNHRK